jgi:PAS domain S-box-containing protein
MKQRLVILLISVLLGLALLEGTRRILPGEISPWIQFSVNGLVVLVAVGIGLLLAERLSKNEAQKALNPTEQSRLEPELYQLNQELYSRAQEQTSELARLNVELQLQMAMHRQAEETALASEERFHNMADNIQEGLTIIENGNLAFVNDRACEIFGACPDGNLINRIKTFAAPEEQARLMRTIRIVGGSGEFPKELEYWIHRNDGSRRCIREYYTRSITNEAARTFVVTTDITEQVQAYQTLENAVSDRTRELSTVLDVSHRITSTLELEPLLHLILDQIQAIIPYNGAAIFTLEGERLYVAAYQVPGIPITDEPLFLTLNKAGVYQQVILKKDVLIIDDVKGDTPLLRAFKESFTLPTTYSFNHAHSWIGIPLVVRDQVTGLLSLTHKDPDYYTQQHVRLAITITNQVAVAIENARLYEQAQNLAVLEERHRIARELHDSVTQLLYGICLYCTATSRSVRAGKFDPLEQNLDEIKDNALQALQEMRLLILELDPPMLQKAGLVAALQASLEVIENRTSLETELKTDGVGRLPRRVETELYRIAMEALNNLVRYSHAQKVIVELRSSDGWVWMEICDNGVGFDLAQARRNGGMGLHNMEQRDMQLNGQLVITSSPGAGTRIIVEAQVDGRRTQPELG